MSESGESGESGGDTAVGATVAASSSAGAGASGQDDTIVAAPTTDAPAEPAARRIRPSRPTVPQPRGDYPELTVVDPAHYVIDREIARGGMGRIQVARDRRLGRDVAIKEVLVASGSIARRFELEARITARLQHPSIISVHEAGTWPSGEPFYAMRLVVWRSLEDAFGDATTYAARLALLPNMLAVADAMAYAHGQRVIHRDLKPRNVVVGEFGETVVLDWGLAKLLGELEPMAGDSAPASAAASATALPAYPASAQLAEPASQNGETTVGEILGTPAYMPPEQAEGKAVDERADVYAIGAMLYHLLAGRAPFVADSNAELIAALHSAPPQPLRALAPAAPTELIAIVERAMARDRDARYPTARALAEDLRRFQTGQLVGAHRYSTRELVRRWIRRYRTVLAAAALATVAVVVIGAIAVQRIVAAEGLAQQERARAVVHAKDAESLMQFMLGDLRDKLATVGRLDLLETVARRAAAYYDVRRSGASDEDVYLASVAEIGIGTVLEAKGDLPGALAEYRKAEGELDALVARAPLVVKYVATAFDTKHHIGGVLFVQGDLPASLAIYRALIVTAEQFLAVHPNAPEAVRMAATAHGRVATIRARQGDVADALVHARTALDLANRLAKLDDGEDTAHTLVAAHARIARLIAFASHDNAAALVEYRLALDIGARQLALDPSNPHWMTELAVSHEEIGGTLKDQGDEVGALAEFRAGFELVKHASDRDPANTEMLTTRASLGEKVGLSLFAQHDYAGALVEFHACEAIWRDLSARDPTNLSWQRGRSVILNKLADVQAKTNDPTGAIASYRDALAIRERLSAKDPSNREWQRDVFYDHFQLSTVYDALHDQAHVAAELRAGIVIADALHAAQPTVDSPARDDAEAHDDLGDALVKLGDLAGARAEYGLASAITHAMQPLAHGDAYWGKLAATVDAKLAK